jgi:hypothetical protein
MLVRARPTWTMKRPRGPRLQVRHVLNILSSETAILMTTLFHVPELNSARQRGITPPRRIRGVRVKLHHHDCFELVHFPGLCAVTRQGSSRVYETCMRYSIGF